MSTRSFTAILAATTMLVAGGAYAADQGAPTPPPGHAAVVKDFGKVSADGVRGYQDLTLARLAIFDGHTADAKRYVDEADTAFGKAKGDESVFQQAEATMRAHTTRTGKDAAGDQMPSASGQAKAGEGRTSQSSNAASDVNKPVAWLPVDGTVVIDEDYTAQPAKAKAVADANKSLAKGDKAGAMKTLKLAEVDTAVSLAVVPLQQTLSDVDQAKQLIDSGKYYEGSQKLKAVQDSLVLTTLDMPNLPAQAASSGTTQPSAQPAH